jgi:branched-chain amino acid transport system ATP-binding protein
VLLEGEDVTDTRPQVRAALGLARTFQRPELFTGLTVREHLVLAYRAKHTKRRVWSDLCTMGSLRSGEPDERARVDELVEQVGMGRLADRPVVGLPLGAARLVELGRALASSPTVLLLDEPSSGLDSSETDQFESTLREVALERGISVLLVEHDVELVMRMCSIVYVLDFGAIIASGPPDEVRTNPAVRAAYLGEGASASESADAEDDAQGTTRVTGPSPDRLAESAPVESPQPQEQSPVLIVQDLSVRYLEFVALSGVSFSVGEGKVMAVLGANGAGKSSMARAISGLAPPCEGRVVLAGQDIGTWPAHQIRRAGIVYLPEERGIFRGLTVMDNLRMAATALDGRKARREAVKQALDIFPNLADRSRQPAGLLSGGEQQMLSLARALVTAPKLLVADEISLGLAPQLVDLVFDGLARARQEGMTVIMIEQYVHRALALADECLILQRGAVVWKGPAGAARGELLRSYLGDAMTAGSGKKR